jgi:hypothetical protein
MITLPVTEQQVLELIRQLPPERKRQVMEDLNAERDKWWEAAADEGENDMRRIARERGQDWDALTEGERATMVDDLLHESPYESRI